jgi:hypothetical protein
MSNATRTSRTTFVGIRLPLDLMSRAQEIGPDITKAIIHGLREAWLMPETADKDKNVET